MADFNELLPAETDAKAFLRQALGKKIKDNFTNLNQRVTELQESLLTFEHFNWRDVLSPTTAPDGWVGNSTLSYPAFSVLRMNVSAGNFVFVETERLFLFTSMTKPITAKCRIKKILDVDMRVGIRVFQNPSISSIPSDAKGIWLERVDATDWRFVSYDTARNNGTPFAKVTDGTWFEVEIEFTDTPSDRVLCRIDSVLKETLTTQLPTGGDLHHIIGSVGSGGGVNVMDVDRGRYAAAGISDAP